MDSTYITQLLIFAVAAMLHGITGMGFPMVGTTSLAFIMPLPQAIAMMILPSLVMNIMVLLAGKTSHLWQELWAYCRQYWRLIVMSAVGSAVGVWLLLWLPAQYVYAMMALLTFYYAIHGYAQLNHWVKPLAIPTHGGSMLFFGFVSGVAGGASNAMSPLVLMYLFAHTQNKHEIAKVSNLCYLVGKVVQLLILQKHFAHFDANATQIMVWLTVVSVFFVYVGAKCRDKLGQVFFKKLIYFILLILSLKIAHSAFQAA